MKHSISNNDPDTLPYQARIASGLNAGLGAWHMLSPWIFDPVPGENAGVWASVIAGAALGVFATMRSLWPREGVALSWSNLFLGGWIVLLPWAYGYADDASRLWNSTVVGAAVVVLAAWSITATSVFHARPRGSA